MTFQGLIRNFKNVSRMDEVLGLFKDSTKNSMTFQDCANPVLQTIKFYPMYHLNDSITNNKNNLSLTCILFWLQNDSFT